jgi:hypothetical protein
VDRGEIRVEREPPYFVFGELTIYRRPDVQDWHDRHRAEGTDVGGVVEGQPVSYPSATIVPDHVETLVAQVPHHGDEFGGNLPLVPPGIGQHAPAMARQVRHHDRVVPDKGRSHFVPSRVRFRVAMEQEDRRTLPAHHPGEPHPPCCDIQGGEPVEQTGNWELTHVAGILARVIGTVRHRHPVHVRNRMSASAVSVGRSSGSQCAQPAMLPPDTSDANSSSMATILVP